MFRVARALALVLALALTPLAGGAKVPACLEKCDLSRKPQIDCCSLDREPCLADSCAVYKSCRGEADALLEERISADSDCDPRSPKGQCTIVLECVRKYEALHRRALKRCTRQLASIPACDCELSPRARRLAARVCQACASVTTTIVSTTTVVTDTTTASTTTTATTSTTRREAPPGEDDIDGCTKACILRLDSIEDCYDRCNDRCDGNKRAVTVCREGCRNGGCTAIKARCANDGDNVDSEFLACHDSKGTTPPDKDEAPCRITMTTTSSTSTTSTSVQTTTSTTTSTMSPQPS